MTSEFLKTNKTIIIFLSFSLVLPKWLLSYYYFADEDISFRIIQEIQDIYYLPLIHNISDFVLNPIYSNTIEKNDLVFAFPILNFAILSFFYKILGSYSFIFFEFLFVFLFILIFYKIFIHLKFEKLVSVLISIILFTSPIVLFYLNFLEFEFINLIKMNFETFYSLRFPRPIMTNLLLFSFFLIAIKIYHREKFNFKLFISLGIISGLTLHSFYFFFIFQNFLLFLIIIFKFKKNLINHLLKNFKMYLAYLILLIFSVILFLTNLSYSDLDYYERLGVVNIDMENRKILLSYFFDFISNKLFLLLLFLNLLTFFFNKNKNNFFLLFFISTIFSTFIFICFSRSVIDIYHFFNWIITSGLLSLFVYSFFHFDRILLKKKLRFRNFLIVLTTLFFIFIYNFSYFSKYQNYESNIRINHNELIKFIKKLDKDLANKEILVLDSKTFIWFVLNDFKNFTYVPENMWTVRSNNQLERDIISVFHFFNLSSQDFKTYIANKKKNFRMLNNNAMRIFGRKYLANKLYTYQNSDDFDEINFIKKIKPTIGHSFAIPKFEINRLLNKFKSHHEMIKPEIIIFNNSSDSLFQKSDHLLNDYCNIFSNRDFNVLLLKTLC